MLKPPLKLAAVALAMIWLSSACGGREANSEPISAPDYQKILSRLQAWDLDLVEIGETRARCYLVNPNTLIVGGGTLEVYEYQNQSSAAIAIGQISPGYFEAQIAAAGLTEGASATHFYKGDQLLVTYTGTDARVVEALSSALGPAF